LGGTLGEEGGYGVKENPGSKLGLVVMLPKKER